MTEACVLVCNCGSSSIKFALIVSGQETQPLSGIAERLESPEARMLWTLNGKAQQQAIPGADHAQALVALLTVLEAYPELQPMAVGHRIVHGGEHFTHSALLDDSVLAQVEACSHLAPLHNPANLLGIQAAQKAFPELPQVGVFDTAFHQSMPARAYRYPVPESWYRDHGVRRYGFHGTSHRFVGNLAQQRLGGGDLGIVTAHLGNGCSAAAIRNQCCVDTTMGLTPLEGLVMGTRSGNVDPSIFSYMAERLHCGVDEITRILNKESGLLGLSGGLASDMRELVNAAEGGHAGAQLAIDVFCYRLAKEIAALAVACGRFDGLVFTGGIGENSRGIRAQVLQHLSLLGLSVDEERNQSNGRDSAWLITTDASLPALVIPTNEELQIARETMSVINADAASQA
ncbi:MAG: acetate kinase [Planctomycetota bacterium]|nr:MAG: acetate kinase [Planctomycetota bacterium]